MDEAQPIGGKCTAPELGELLLDYALHRLPAPAETDFEVHLLECDDCFENFRAVVRTAAYLNTCLERPPEKLPPAFHFLHRHRKGRWVRRLVTAAILVFIGFLIGLLVAGQGTTGPTDVGWLTLV
jgi:predicted anti-sigma-YlaC factor YlaD